MSGSDKQTYYKLGTSPNVPDCAEEFAATLTAAGCCHGDLALAEGISSLREFYHLVQAGVAFPTDPMGDVHRLQDRPRPGRAGHQRRAQDQPVHERMPAARGRSLRHSRSSTTRRSAHLLTVGAGRCEADRRRRRPGQDSRGQRTVGVTSDQRLPRGQRRARRRRARGAVQDQRLSRGAGRPPRPGLRGGPGRGEPHRIAIRPGQHEIPLERLRHVHAGDPAHLQHGRRRQARAGVPGRFLPLDEEHGHQHLPQGLPVAVRSAEDRGPQVLADRRSGLQREPEGPAGVPGLPPEPHGQRRHEPVRHRRAGAGGLRLSPGRRGPSADSHRAAGPHEPAWPSRSTTRTASTCATSRSRSPSAPSTTTAASP